MVLFAAPHISFYCFFQNAGGRNHPPLVHSEYIFRLCSAAPRAYHLLHLGFVYAHRAALHLVNALYAGVLAAAGYAQHTLYLRQAVAQ